MGTFSLIERERRFSLQEKGSNFVQYPQNEFRLRAARVIAKFSFPSNAREYNMWFVYILECKDGSLYTGITDNPERRFDEHKNKRGGKYTKSKGGVKRMLYKEEHATRSLALKRESQIKSWRREKKLNLINKILK
ncbi:MAG: GIY-YIG nuclease family protein [Patescibacteria group bacterium]